MLKSAILQRLHAINQIHLAQGVETLSENEQAKFLDQIDTKLFEMQQEKLRCKSPIGTLEPVVHADLPSTDWKPLGLEKLSKGKVACLILAGGQGSRLNSSLPKALIPIHNNKTLLELQLEKINNAPCAIITSPGNHEQITDFLKKTPFQPTLIKQHEAPLVDSHGNWFLRKPGQLATGPDGNGHALHLLKTHGILKTWKNQGIEQITITPIDNVLADPVDPILIGHHTPDITAKAIARENPQENVGIFVYKEGRISVQEYSELSIAQQGNLAHIGLFTLSLSFARRVAQTELPWHIAYKKDTASGEWVWKFERFIFDILTLSQKTHLLLYPREEVYAPLKNREGEKSLATVQEALHNRARSI